MDKTYRITDLDGSNPRNVTVAEYKAMVAEAAAKARAIHAANIAAVRAART